MGDEVETPLCAHCLNDSVPDAEYENRQLPPATFCSRCDRTPFQECDDLGYPASRQPGIESQVEFSMRLTRLFKRVSAGAGGLVVLVVLYYLLVWGGVCA